ncbi:winged helix-turn-helix transcriptional regulator, partial [Desulfovibrio sp.]
YYDALTVVRASNDIGHWVRFFLRAVRETARTGVRTFQAIMSLREESQGQVMGLGGRAPNGTRLLEQLYLNPFVTVQQVAAALDLSIPTVNALFREFLRLGLVVEITGRKRNRLFFFKKYYGLFLNQEADEDGE